MVEEDGAGRAGDGGFHIGIAEDDGGRFAAQLEGDLLQIAGGRLDDQLADLGGAGEGHLVDIVMGGERRTRRLAIAGQDIDHALGEAGFLDQLAQAQRAERRLLGDLEDDGAAGRQARPQLPGRHEQREVPGDDLADDADGLAHRVGQEIIGHRPGNGRAGHLGGPAAHVAEHVRGQGHVGDAGDGDGLAVVDRLELGEFLQILVDQLGQLPHQLAALGAGHARPRTFVEGAARRRDGTVDVLLVGLGDLGQHGPGRGVVDRKGLARGGGDPLAIDQELAVMRQESGSRFAEPAVQCHGVHRLLHGFSIFRRSDIFRRI